MFQIATVQKKQIYTILKEQHIRISKKLEPLNVNVLMHRHKNKVT